jgi:hypothetical protein
MSNKKCGTKGAATVNSHSDRAHLARVQVVILAIVSAFLASCSVPDNARLQEKAEAAEREARAREAQLREAQLREAEEKERHPSIISHQISHNYDKSSLRFLDDQLVVDLVFTNNAPHNLQNVRMTIDCPGHGNEGQWKKETTFPSWTAGSSERVVVPLINNHLDRWIRNPEVGPEYKYSFSGTYQAGEKVRTVSSEGSCRSRPFIIIQPGQPDPRDTWQTHFTGSMASRGGVPIALIMKRITAEFPSLVNVQMMVVGYSADRKEVYRKKVACDSWLEGQEWSFDIPPTAVSHYRFRGVGKRRISNAEDLNKQQVYFICENWVLK